MGREADNKDIDRKKATNVSGVQVQSGKQNNTGNQTNKRKQVSTGRQTSTGKQVSTERQSSTGKQAGTGRQTSTGKQVSTERQSSTGKQISTGKQSSTGKQTGVRKHANTGKQESTGKQANIKKTGKNRKKSKNIAKKSASVFSKITFKTAMYIIGAVLVVLISRSAFAFGEKIFSEEGMAEKGKGQEVVVTIPADASTGEVASILKKNGLIESEFVFKIQTILYESEKYSGTYTINTEYSPDEIIEALRPKEEEK